MRRAALLGMTMAIACVPAVSAAGKTPTTVTIDSVFLGSGQTHWAGDIFSKRRACKDKRRVLIFRVRPGKDEKLGSTRSYMGSAVKGYFWTYFEEGAAATAKYYAKVKATDACEGDRSKGLRGPSF